MSVIWVAGKAYRRVDYESEADLETAILEVQHRLFGPNRFYIGCQESHRNEGINPEYPGRLSIRPLRFQASPLRGRKRASGARSSSAHCRPDSSVFPFLRGRKTRG